VLQAYAALEEQLRRQVKLIVVGDAPYAEAYKAELKTLAVEGVTFTGFQFGDCYRLLQLGALIYIQATEVGGTHPALVEAMGFGNCVVANDTPENREVLANAGCFYQMNNPGALVRELTNLLSQPELIRRFRAAALLRAQETYSWDAVTAAYEKLFVELVGM
jgi:glycosyltransferase involved in cell wall biosynthesis